MTPSDGVPCRVCGAVLGPRSNNKYGLCANCWRSCLAASGASYDLRWKDPGKVVLDAGHVNDWLAGRIERDVRRLERTGIIERCEALSNWRYGGFKGTQCARCATTRRDGRLVCSLHAKALQPVYVTDQHADGYATLKGLFIEVAQTDQRFAEILLQAAASLQREADAA